MFRFVFYIIMQYILCKIILFGNGYIGHACLISIVYTPPAVVVVVTTILPFADPASELHQEYEKSGVAALGTEDVDDELTDTGTVVAVVAAVVGNLAVDD